MFYLISIETVILFLTLLFLIRYYIHKKWQALKKLNIPHNPPSIRSLGNIADDRDPDSVFKNQLLKKKQFGKIYGQYNGLNLEITIGDPKILKQIFIKEFNVFSDRTNIFKKINGKELNTGVNVISGEQWKRVRSTLSPTFSSVKLKEMFGIIENCVDCTVLQLEKAVKEENGRFETKEIFSRLSLDVICSAAFSTNVNAQSYDDNSKKIIELAKKTFDFSVFGRPWFIFILIFPWIENLVALFDYSILPKDSINYFKHLVDHLIESRNKNEKISRTDLMQLMLQSKISEQALKDGASKGLTKTEIVGNSMIMMLAGYETTGNAMIFFAFNLATHQHVQKKLYEEIKEALQQHERINYKAITKLKYLDMCINESLRLYGLIPRNSRYASKDITIDKICIPKGSLVTIPVYGLAHDEEYWEKPFEFNPDRMKDMSKIDPMVFQPFGAGPRNCVGMRFALLEIKLAFCKLLQRFCFDVCDDTPKPPLEMTFKASMKPKETVYLKVSLRE